MDEERERSHRVAQEKLKGTRSKEKSHAGDRSDGGLDSYVKSMSSQQKTECDSKVASIVGSVGGEFPDEGSESGSSSSSGKESDASKKPRRRRKIKSGAEIKKRPVIRTELWPHTVAYEEDGDDVSSEDITLARFCSCFTMIMNSSECGRSESEGRSSLLQAIFMVVEILHWPEARSFHNLTMIKIEQGRLNWKSRFSVLANEFIDKKVRKALRSKAGLTNTGQAARSNANFRSNRGSNQSSGNGYRGQAQNGGNRPFHLICWQWNNATCTYGVNCKRWHCCRTCAETGKWGEAHKASWHRSSGTTPQPQGEQRT